MHGAHLTRRVVEEEHESRKETDLVVKVAVTDNLGYGRLDHGRRRSQGAVLGIQSHPRRPFKTILVRKHLGGVAGPRPAILQGVDGRVPGLDDHGHRIAERQIDKVKSGRWSDGERLGDRDVRRVGAHRGRERHGHVQGDIVPIVDVKRHPRSGRRSEIHLGLGRASGDGLSQRRDQDGGDIDRDLAVPLASIGANDLGLVHDGREARVEAIGTRGAEPLAQRALDVPRCVRRRAGQRGAIQLSCVNILHHWHRILEQRIGHIVRIERLAIVVLEVVHAPHGWWGLERVLRRALVASWVQGQGEQRVGAGAELGRAIGAAQIRIVCQRTFIELRHVGKGHGDRRDVEAMVGPVGQHFQIRAAAPQWVTQAVEEPHKGEIVKLEEGVLIEERGHVLDLPTAQRDGVHDGRAIGAAEVQLHRLDGAETMHVVDGDGPGRRVADATNPLLLESRAGRGGGVRREIGAVGRGDT